MTCIDDSYIPETPEKYAFKLTQHRRELLHKVVDSRTRHFTLALEDLKDQHNISAVIRTCEVFGFQDVHIIEELNPYRVTRSILKGSFKWMDIYRYRKRAVCMQELRRRGYRIAVASTAAGDDLTAIDLSLPTAFYMGSETLGNHPDTLEAADVRFRLPQYGLTESMNVSVCAGVLLANLEAWMLKSGGRARFSLPDLEKRTLLTTFYERSAVGLDRNSPIHFVDE